MYKSPSISYDRLKDRIKELNEKAVEHKKAPDNKSEALGCKYTEAISF
jgi:hypothetical protein